MSEQGNVVRRSIGIVFSDGGLLALTSHLPAGGGGIDEEEVTAVLCEADGAPLTFEETLLSTEYGEDGVQRRGAAESRSEARGAPAGDAGAADGRRGDAAAARRRLADQLGHRAAPAPRFADRLLPLVGRR